jgi:type II secretory pathway pseudopilin PulG
MHLKKAISLLEILMVIAIVAVLAAIIIFNLRPAEVYNDSKQSKRESDKRAIQDAVDTYISEKAAYPVVLAGLNEGIYDICKQTYSNCTPVSVNIDELVTAGYLAKVPFDPDCEVGNDTCYNLQYIPDTAEYVILINGETEIDVDISGTVDDIILPPVIEAEELDVVINGTTDSDRFGTNVTNIGDVNKDGYDDVLVGTQYASSNAGKAYLFYGKVNMPNVIEAENANVIISASAGNMFFGKSVAGTGDVNNDGYDDFIIGGSTGAGTYNGVAYLFYGSNSLPSTLQSTNANVVITNTLGRAVYTDAYLDVGRGGDINNDGFDDILVGSIVSHSSNTTQGRAYVIYGSASLASAINTSSSNIRIDGNAANDFFAFSMTAGGDINNDNYNDIIISAQMAPAGGTQRGTVSVYYGASTMGAILQANTPNLLIQGTDNNDNIGGSVSTADVNRDRYDDIIIGASNEDEVGVNRGRVYIINGASGLTSPFSAETANTILNGTNDGDLFGWSVSGVGDMNGDGYDEVAVGAYEAEDSGVGRGRVYVLEGSNTLASSIPASSIDLIMNGTFDNDRFGIGVSGGGDINQNGYADLIIGAYQAEDMGSDRGRVYLYLPSATPIGIIKLDQTGVAGVLGTTPITIIQTTTVTASGGNGTGAYEFRQNGGTGTVAFSGSGASRTITPSAVGTAIIEVRKLGDTNYNDSAWVSAGTLTINKATQASVSGVIVTNPITLSQTSTVTISGGSGTGLYEIRQNGGTGTVAFSGSGTSRTVTPSAIGTAVIEVRRLGDATYNDTAWVSAGTLTVNADPCSSISTPAAPTGPNDVAPNTSGKIYTVGAVAGADYYEWNYTGTNATINSGQGTTSITVTYASNATSGSWRVRVTNNNSPASCSPDFVSSYGSTLAVTVSYGWTYTISGVGYDEAYGLALDSSNNVYVTGNFQDDNTDFNPLAGTDLRNTNGAYDMFMLRMNSNQTYGYTYTIGGTGYATDGFDVGVDSTGNIFYTGRYSSLNADFNPLAGTDIRSSAGVPGTNDFFWSKINSGNTYNYTHTSNAANEDEGHNLVIDGSNNVYFLGSINASNIDMDPTAGTDLKSATPGIYLTKMNANGTYGYTYVTAGTIYPQGIDVDSSGNVYIISRFYYNNVDFDPTAGTDLKSSAGGGDIAFTKINANGTYGYTYTIGSTGDEWPSNISIDASGNIFLLGSFYNASTDFNPFAGTDSKSPNGVAEVFLTKINSNLTYGYTYTFGGGGSDMGLGIDTDTSGNIYITGFFSGSAGDFDPTAGTDMKTPIGSMMYLTKINANGSYGFTNTFGGGGLTKGTAIRLASNGDIYVAGTFSGSNVDFDPTSGSDLKSTTAQSVFFSRFKQ